MNSIAILTGGDNSEREISLISAQSVLDGLNDLGYHSVKVYDLPGDLSALHMDLTSNKIDFAFIMIHGVGGEDGQFAGLLDTYNVPYQCASRDVLALTMNKWRTKCLRRAFNLPVANDLLFKVSEYSLDELDNEIEKSFGYPCVWKELDQGSSKGVHIIHDKTSLDSVRINYSGDKVILLEEFIDGEEITIPILDIDGKSTPLPLIHIIPPKGGFDYENKYNGETQEIVPSNFSKKITDACEQLALQAYLAVGCSKYGRVDAILTPKGLVLLEINTIPGFTSQSLFPKSALVSGYSFSELLEHMINTSLTDFQKKGLEFDRLSPVSSSHD